MNNVIVAPYQCPALGLHHFGKSAALGSPLLTRSRFGAFKGMTGCKKTRWKIKVSLIRMKTMDLEWLGSRKNTIPSAQPAVRGLYLREFIEPKRTMGTLRGCRQETQSH